MKTKKQILKQTFITSEENIRLRKTMKNTGYEWDSKSGLCKKVYVPRKLTKADEFLKLNALINDKEVNDVIDKVAAERVREMEMEAEADLQIMMDRNDSKFTAK